MLISATGTGKTYLSAFDVQQYQPKKVFICGSSKNHCRKSNGNFQELVRRYNISMGIFSGSSKELECDYIFSTIQTVSKPENLKLFEEEYFDYIVIDETHRAGAASYKRILETTFTPKFLLRHDSHTGKD